MNWRRLPTLLALVLGCIQCTGDGGRKREVVTIAALTGLRGTTEPCGCTSKPLGGLDRVAARVEATREKGPTAFVLSGDQLYAHKDPPPELFDQERKKAEVMAQVLAKLAPTAILPGETDLNVQRGHFEELVETTKLPAYRRSKNVQPQNIPDSTLLTMGGIPVGFLGLPLAAGTEVDLYTTAALALRKQGAEFVVALVPYGGDDAVKFVKGIDRINVAIAAGSDELRDPRVVDGTLIVEAGDRGRYLGLLRLHPGEAGDEPKGSEDPSAEETSPWVYYDRGVTEKKSLESRIARLKGAVQRMEAGPAREARAKKLSELEQQLATHSTEPPKGNYVTWEVETIEKSVKPVAWATEMLAGYNRSLCEVVQKATAGRECAPATSPAAGYIGTETCGACHKEALAVWKKTKHAIAWETLVRDGKECDLTCIGCHTVGYDAPGGYCRLQDAAFNGDVGCESCHGPGSGHAANPKLKTAAAQSFTVAKQDSSVCTRCHNEEHSDLFDYNTYLPQILGPGHGR